MSPASTRSPVVLRTLVVTGALALTLTACTAPSQAAPSATPTSGEESPSTPVATPTAAATPELASTPFDVDCGELLDPGSLAAWYPGMTAVADDEASGDASRDGEALQQVADADGTTCTWQDSSGATVTVGVAHFDADSLDELANDLVATSNSVPTFGVEGYFDTPGEIGTAEAFSSPAFVVARSTTFLEPGDAEPVVSAVLSALKQLD